MSDDFLRTQIAGSQLAITRSSETVPLGVKGLSGVSSSRLPLNSADLVEIMADKQTSGRS